jgi:phenylalanyl-tRNA synthetase beta chain
MHPKKNVVIVMIIPLSWLKEFVDLSDLSLEDIESKLTMAGLEVDAIEETKLPFEGIVIGKVLTKEKHPNADTLCLATVSTGDAVHNVVCGAPNCREGLVTAFAPLGARLYDDAGKAFKIKKTKIRGEESHGMLCSEAELGLTEESDSIIEYPSEYTPGTDVSTLYRDTTIEISLTPNLGHCHSVLGISRELGALLSKKITSPTPSCEEGSKAITAAITVSVEDSEGCPRYGCRLIEGVKIGPSPSWLQQRLSLCDIRSVNNVVDVTNLVLLECGHPMHAFDYDTITDNKIIVKRACAGEGFTTLDDKTHTLTDDDLLICDGKRPIALAGVMGGQNSEVQEATTNVLLEAAYFLPTMIRRTSKRHGIISDSSKRFERGCDPNMILYALDRAAQLIKELTGGTIASGFVDVAVGTFSPHSVTCRYTRINSVLGINLALNEVETIFNNFGYVFSFDGDDTFTIDIPTYRHDVTGEIDIIEEVARMYGYHLIANDDHMERHSSSSLDHDPIYLFEKEIRKRLLASGLQEFMNCDLISPDLVDIVVDSPITADAIISVMNPTSQDQSILRPSLLPGLLQSARHNQAHRTETLSCFEMGRIHAKNGESYKEHSMVALLLSGERRPYHWEVKAEETDVFDIKGYVENLFTVLDIEDYTFRPSTLEILHPGRQASLYLEDQHVGIIGEVHPTLIRSFDIRNRLFFAELNLHVLSAFTAKGRKMSDIALYPGSERDWTITLEEKIPYASLRDAIASVRSSLLTDVLLLDIYRGEGVTEGTKNVTLRLTYRSKKKTLSQEAVEREHGRITSAVYDALGEHICTI